MIASVTVTTSPTQVLAAPSSKPYGFVSITNNGSTTAWLKVATGSETLDTSNGIQLAAGASFCVDQDRQAHLFRAGVQGITSSGSTVLGVQAE